MSVAANAWITLAQFKAYAGIVSTDATRDAMIEPIIDGVSVALSAFCGREIAKTTYTNEYIDGNGERDLLLPNYPIVSVSAITENDVSLTEGTTEDYILYAKEGRLARIDGSWYPFPKSIKLTYIAGYTVQGTSPGTGETALPADLALACKLQVAAEWKRSSRAEWGLTNISINDGSIATLANEALLPQVKAILRRHTGVMAG